MEDLKKNFGKRVKEIRKRRGLTLEKLAEMISMDSANLCKMENGNHFPQPKNLAKLAKTLDVEVKEFFDYSNITAEKELKTRINFYIDKLSAEDLKFLYKFLSALCEYNN